MLFSVQVRLEDDGKDSVERVILHREQADPEDLPIGLVPAPWTVGDIANAVRRYLKENPKPRHPNLRATVLAMQDEYRKRTGKEAAIIEFTPSTELGLYTLGFMEIGALAEELLIKGARETFPTFMGMKPVWGAKEFRVRGEGE